MKASAIYRKAAACVADEEGLPSCTAIQSRALKRTWIDDTKEAQDFARSFAPYPDGSIFDEAPCYQFGVQLRAEKFTDTELHHWRVLALCFMSAISADEERSAHS